MIAEIKQQIEAKVAELEARQRTVIKRGDYEYAAALTDQVRGLKIALEIVDECQQSHGKTMNRESAVALAESGVELITVGMV